MSRIYQVFSLVTLIAVVVAMSGLLDVGCKAPASAPTPTASTVPATAENTFKLGFGDTYWGLGGFLAQRVVETVRYTTGGKVAIDLYPSAQLGEDDVLATNLQNGTLDMAILPTAKISQFSKALFMLDIPFLFSSPTDLLEFIYSSDREFSSIAKAKLEQVRNEAGFHVLNLALAGRRDFVSHKEVTSLSQIAGLKMRLPTNEIWLDAWALVGAQTTALPWSELFTSLQTGAVDCAEMTGADYLETDFGSVAPYWLGTNHIQLVQYVGMSNKAWDSLSPANQGIITETMARAGYLESNTQIGLSISLLGPISRSAKVMSYPSKEELTQLQQLVVPGMLDKYGNDIGMDIIAALAERSAPAKEWYEKHKKG